MARTRRDVADAYERTMLANFTHETWAYSETHLWFGLQRILGVRLNKSIDSLRFVLRDAAQELLSHLLIDEDCFDPTRIAVDVLSNSSHWRSFWMVQSSTCTICQHIIDTKGCRDHQSDWEMNHASARGRSEDRRPCNTSKGENSNTIAFEYTCSHLE